MKPTWAYIHHASTATTVAIDAATVNGYAEDGPQLSCEISSRSAQDR
jgi:hypothetical protein